MRAPRLRPLPAEAGAVVAGALPRLLDDHVLVEKERSLAALQLAARITGTHRDAGAETDAAAASEDADRRPERGPARGDAFGNPRVGIASVGKARAAHRRAPAAHDILVARAVPRALRRAYVARALRRRCAT